MKRISFISALCFAIGLVTATSEAITITRTLITSGNSFSDGGATVAGGVPGNSTGAGNLTGAFTAAADWWESALPGAHAIEIEYGWAPLGGTLLGSHRLLLQGGAPNRETKGMIRFDNDLSSQFYLDSTPLQNNEWSTYTTATTNFGAGAINSQRRFGTYSGPAGTDLFTVALHEIGHALALASANSAYRTETVNDNDVDVVADLPFAGSQIPTNNVTAPIVDPVNDYNAHLNASLGSGNTGPIMLPTISGSTRKHPTAADILATAQISQYTNAETNLDPRPASISMSADIDFGYVLVGTSPTQNLTVENDGLAGSALFGTFDSGAGDFSLTTSSSYGLLDMNGTENATYQYAPGQRGVDNDTVTTTSNQGNVDNQLTGQGVAPQLGSATNSPAGMVRIGDPGSTDTDTVTVNNVGDGNLAGAGPAFNLSGTMAGAAGPFFAGAGGAVSLTDGSDVDFDYTFSAPAGSSHGIQTEIVQLSLTNGNPNGTNSAYNTNVQLEGTAVGPVYESDPGTPPANDAANGIAIDLGQVDWLSGPEETTAILEITNASNDTGGDSPLTDLTLLDAIITGANDENFSIDFDSDIVLHEGESIELTITFQTVVPEMMGEGFPAFDGLKEALLEIRTDQNAPLGQLGDSFYYELSGLQTPEPTSIVVWTLMGFAGLFWGWRRKRKV